MPLKQRNYIYIYIYLYIYTSTFMCILLPSCKYMHNKHHVRLLIHMINILIIIIEFCQYHVFSWLSLTIHPHQPSLLIQPLDGIQCSPRAGEVFAGQSTLVCQWIGNHKRTLPALANMSCSSWMGVDSPQSSG